MRIKCPVCGEVLYTNPFSANHSLHCDHCQTDLYRNRESFRPLRRVFLTDFALLVGAVPMIWFMYRDMKATLFVVLMLVSEWLFEMPQRTFYRNGILRYEAKPKPET
ncbi:MAG: hypothetical protein IJI33_04600 [Solobacterium sp.]|nr:hypothetical protein [Solobacterium sp.]MBQ6355986.1 hypothetical protein [Solobacterium sp.]MBQ6532258.1 hypothetical protein [Solobacterium sp.]MBR0214159.1 hypothetical protein [Solobacterium sp.]